MSLMGYPICLIEIHGDDETYEVAMESSAPIGNSPAHDLLACTTEKRISMESAGTFELHFACTRDAQGRTWADKIHPQNLVVIQMMHHSGALGPDGAGELHTVMIGLVDHVTDGVAMNNRGVPNRSIVVRGRDATKMLTTGMVTYWNFLGAALLGAAQHTDIARFNDTPSRIARELLETLVVKFLQTTVRINGAPTQLWDLLGYDLSSYEAELPAGLDAKFTAGEGSFWQFFVKLASPPFHELFVDTRRRKTLDTNGGRETRAPRFTLGKDQSCPVLMLRPTPFPYITPPVRSLLGTIPDNKLVEPDGTLNVPEVHVIAERDGLTWDGLIRHEIGHQDGLRGEPIQEQLSVSDAEQYNLFLPLPSYPVLPDNMFLLSVPPIFDRARFHRYGYRPLTPSCALLQPKQSGDVNEPIWDFYISLAWRLASWYVLNDQFRSGTKLIQLSPHIHVGERLVDRSPWQHRTYEYYVESVTHRFMFGQSATTTLGLTRGLPEESYLRISEVLSEQGLEQLAPTKVSQTYRDLMGQAQRRQN